MAKQPNQVWDLVLEMMEQGEFECLTWVPDSGLFIVQWWCRYTDKTYDSWHNKNFRNALENVLEQARNDKVPWVTEAERLKTEARIGKPIYIPALKVKAD
jgi:hypothetical protein